MTESSYPVEFERVIEALNRSGVPYVIVGGVAVVMHGVDRLTADLDVVIDLDPLKLRPALATLGDLGYRPRAPVPLTDFADADKRKLWAETKNMQVFSLWDPKNELPVLDLFIDYPVDFSQLLANSVAIDLGGLDTRIASTEDLIDMKRKAGRDKDFQDIEALNEKRKD